MTDPIGSEQQRHDMLPRGLGGSVGPHDTLTVVSIQSHRKVPLAQLLNRDWKPLLATSALDVRALALQQGVTPIGSVDQLPAFSDPDPAEAVCLALRVREWRKDQRR